MLAQHGRMMPKDGLDQIKGHDAIYLGAVGCPAVPDHISLWGLLIPIRRNFEQYVNLRPVRLMHGVLPLAGRGRTTSTSGSCARTPRASIRRSAGASIEGTDAEMVMQETVFTGAASTASCVTPSSSRGRGRRSISRRPPNRTASPSPCRTGTSASKRWARTTPTYAWTSTTSTS